jgi:hypothetical protein
MCVAGSQKPMQSFKVSPPPPGALGLSEEEPGDSARLLWPLPPVENCVGSCGESGAIGGTCCVGGKADDGAVDGVAVVDGARGPAPAPPAVGPLEEGGGGADGLRAPEVWASAASMTRVKIGAATSIANKDFDRAAMAAPSFLASPF